MLRAIRSLTGYKIRAADGDIGKVDQFLFDDQQWGLRYLIVETGHWFAKRKVLISPIVIERADWLSQHLNVSLSRVQVKGSPGFDPEFPLSRQDEIEIFDYYKWPYYWLGEGLWGQRPMDETFNRPAQESEHSLYSTRELIGCHIQATDREFGHIEDLIVNQENWTIRYIVVATQNFWPGGRSVLLAPQWITKINIMDKKVHASLDSATIKDGPQFDPYAPVNREYEVRLYDYYGRPKYWETELEHEHNPSPPPMNPAAPLTPNPKV